jgi:hypothetical protein
MLREPVRALPEAQLSGRVRQPEQKIVTSRLTTLRGKHKRPSRPGRQTEMAKFL